MQTVGTRDSRQAICRDQPKAAPSWEYRTIDASCMEFGQLHRCLAELRSKGWELLPVEEVAPASSGFQVPLRRLIGNGEAAKLMAGSQD